MKSILRLLTKVCAATVLWSFAGCGGGGGSGIATTADRSTQSVVPNLIQPVPVGTPVLPLPTPSTTLLSIGPGRVCPQFISLKQLVYPAPGSTWISPFTHVIVVSGDGNQVTLTSPGWPTIVSTHEIPVPQPLPTPNTGSTLGQTAFAIPTLSFYRRYTVVVQNTALIGCPDGTPTNVGSFTTGFLFPIGPFPIKAL